MRTTQRILSLGVFAAFGVAIAGSFMELRVSPDEVTPPALLPAAHANPAEVGFQDTLRSGETLSELLSRASLAESEAASCDARRSPAENGRESAETSCFRTRSPTSSTKRRMRISRSRG